MVHNKLPVQERLFRINLSKDPYCFCSSAAVQDTSHFFSTCDRTLQYWDWTKEIALSLLGIICVSDECLLNLKWPKTSKDRDICWINGHYVFIIWDMLMMRKLPTIGDLEFFGFLRYKYKEAFAVQAVRERAGLL